MRHPTANTGLFIVAAVAIVLATLASPHAQRRGNNNAGFGAPISTDTIVDDPNSYFGKQITISAAVEEVVSQTAFLVDQRKAVGAREVQSIGKPVLVIAPYLTTPLEKSKYLMVSGQLVKFAPAAVEKLVADYKLDLASDVVSKYEGQPVLVATSVLDARYAEIGRKPPPPATSDEVAMSAAMKSISAAFAALRTASQATKAEEVAQSAATLQPLFTKVETAWDDIGQVPAAQLARDARGHAAAIQGAVAAGNWMAVQASATALNQVCGNCHGAYRERQDDGTFRFKPGSF